MRTEISMKIDGVEINVKSDNMVVEEIVHVIEKTGAMVSAMPIKSRKGDKVVVLGTLTR